MIARILPGWLYDQMVEKGWDMTEYVRAEYQPLPEKERVVQYLNRESRRKALRARRKR